MRWIDRRNLQKATEFRTLPQFPLGSCWHGLSKVGQYMKTQDKYSEDNVNEVEEGKELLDAAANATEHAVVEARNRLRSALEAAGETCARVKEKAIDSAKATDKLIRDNPYQAIGIALGVGALLGFLLSRRTRD
jgi:ElaB/YqjD/DUF883 family membrane-anchored ribosome-binding protein